MADLLRRLPADQRTLLWLREVEGQSYAELAAILAFSAIRNNDKVGVILFTDRIEKYVAPKKGRRHVLRVVREILAFQPTGHGTNIAGALDYLNRVQHRRAVTFVLSDFQDTGFDKKLRLAGKRHDIVVLNLCDPREEELPAVGLVELRDAETGERAVVDTFDRQVRAAFADLANARLTRLVETFRSASVDQIEIHTDRDYILPLVKFFRMRGRRA